MPCAASARTSESETKLADLKKDLISTVGSEAGTDLSDEEKAQVLERFDAVDGLGMQQPETQDLVGTDWRIIYSDSKLSALVACRHDVILTAQMRRHVSPKHSHCMGHVNALIKCVHWHSLEKHNIEHHDIGNRDFDCCKPSSTRPLCPASALNALTIISFACSAWAAAWPAVSREHNALLGKRGVRGFDQDAGRLHEGAPPLLCFK